MKVLSIDKLRILASVCILFVQTMIFAQAARTDSITLTKEDAQKLVDSWERVEKDLETRGPRSSAERAARPDGQGLGDPAAPVPYVSADLDEIRRCVCIIKEKVCNTNDIIGNCLDETIATVTGAECITVGEINEICASVISWLKTIVSELRGNQETCPAP